jgi:hypothetical protein
VSLKIIWPEGVQEAFNTILIVDAITQILVEQMVEVDLALARPSVKTGTVVILTTLLVLMLLLEVPWHNGLMDDAHLGLHHLCVVALTGALKNRTFTKRALILMVLVHKLVAKSFTTLK